MAQRPHTQQPFITEERKKDFAELVAGQGMLPQQAAKHLGLKDPRSAASRYMKDPLVQEELKRIYEQNRAAMRITREKVYDLVEEAIEMARLQGDPTAMLRGVQELNRMNGFYAPEEKKVTFSAEQRRVLSQFDQMDDEQLARIAAEGVIVEGEFEEVKDE